MPTTLEPWLQRQCEISAERLTRCVSATALTRERAPFGQRVAPAPGSVLASPAFADWDPRPDYFFHWVRDAAIVIRSLLLPGPWRDRRRRQWRRAVDDFVTFSLTLTTPRPAPAPAPSSGIAPDHVRYLRPADDLARVSSRRDRLLAEPRFNPDGGVDIFRWARPQFDGPALRALTCLDIWARRDEPSPALRELLRIDLDFTAARAGRPCIGLWEEDDQFDRHYHTALVQLGALTHGARWAETCGEPARAARYRQALPALRELLDGHWLPADGSRGGYYRALRDRPAAAGDDGPDASALLAVLDARLPGGRHSLRDERVRATVAGLETLFRGLFPINRRLPPDCGPLLGRSRADRYFGGGAWYPTTLALAEYHYRRGEPARGDAVLAAVRRFIPNDGALSEQIDRASGEPASAEHLSWSYAALLGAAHARRQALASAAGR